MIWQPQNDRENPDEFQIFTRNALEFTWYNQNKKFWTSFTKSKRFQLHMSWLKCSLLTFNEEDYLKSFAFWFFFLATWVNIAALLYVKEAIDRGFLFAIRKLRLSSDKLTALLPNLSANTLMCSRVISLILIMISIS